MKAVIFAGGFGTRISEESHLRPKPMVEIGGRPILWHILKTYSAHGINDFIICCGYKAEVIKEYFCNYFTHSADIRVTVGSSNFEVLQSAAEPWTVTMIDTGLDTMTGGRLLRVKNYVGDEPFCLTYGDGVSDVNITDLIRFHKAHGLWATVTAVQPPARFGALTFEGDRVVEFEEKPKGDGRWINGGFFVLNKEVFNFIEGDSDIWEQAPIRKIAEQKQLMAYRHRGFWAAMDTLRDRAHLEELWARGAAPWKIWT